MEETIAEKDVGVIIDNKLFFDKHITEKVNKANSIIGVIGSLANSMVSGRSFIYNTKSTGPRTDPCGIPEVTDFHSEDSPLTDPFCLQIYKSSDCEDLQKDMHLMHAWSEKWMLKFHPDKCKTMRIGRSKVEKHEYTLKADLKPISFVYFQSCLCVF
jgi:hypothetical protein